MVESNAELIRGMYEALDREGVEGVVAFVAPEFEVSVPASLSAEPDTYRGADGLRRYFDLFYEVMEEVRFEPGEMTEIGDAVVVPFTVRTKGRASGIETSQQAVSVWRFRDGLATRMDLFTDQEAALAAAAEPLSG